MLTRGFAVQSVAGPWTKLTVIGRHCVAGHEADRERTLDMKAVIGASVSAPLPMPPEAAAWGGDDGEGAAGAHSPVGLSGSPVRRSQSDVEINGLLFSLKVRGMKHSKTCPKRQTQRDMSRWGCTPHTRFSAGDALHPQRMNFSYTSYADGECRQLREIFAMPEDGYLASLRGHRDAHFDGGKSGGCQTFITRPNAE